MKSRPSEGCACTCVGACKRARAQPSPRLMQQLRTARATRPPVSAPHDHPDDDVFDVTGLTRVFILCHAGHPLWETANCGKDTQVMLSAGEAERARSLACAGSSG